MRSPIRIRSSRGFTLNEPLVALVVIGLILGSVLIGANILHNARVTFTVQAIQSLQSAIATYKQNYGALPGDDATTETRFATAGVTGRGGGDGLIGSTGLAETFKSSTDSEGNGPGESANLWQHVRAAGLVKGQGSESTPMANAFGGMIGVQNAAFSAHGFRLGTNVICASGLPGAAARAVDRRMDDGDALTGTMRGGISVTTEAVAYVDDATYVVCMGL